MGLKNTKEFPIYGVNDVMGMKLMTVCKIATRQIPAREEVVQAARDKIAIMYAINEDDVFTKSLLEPYMVMYNLYPLLLN